MERSKDDVPAEGAVASAKNRPATKKRPPGADLGKNICVEISAVPDPTQYHKIPILLTEYGSENLELQIQTDKLIVRDKVSGKKSITKLPRNIHVCGRRCPIGHADPFRIVQPFNFRPNLELHILKSFDKSLAKGVESPVTFDLASLPRVITIERSKGKKTVQVVEKPMTGPTKETLLSEYRKKLGDGTLEILDHKVARDELVELGKLGRKVQAELEKGIKAPEPR